MFGLQGVFIGSHNPGEKVVKRSDQINLFWPRFCLSKIDKIVAKDNFADASASGEVISATVEALCIGPELLVHRSRRVESDRIS